METFAVKRHIIVLFFLFPFLVAAEEEGPLHEWKRAEELYVQAKRASTFLEQQEALEKVLEELLIMETRELGAAASSKIDTTIGNLYSHRGQEALATLYFRRALKNTPHRPPLRERLNVSLLSLGLSPERAGRAIPLDLLHGLFFFASLLTLALLSTFLWAKVPLGKVSISLTTTVAICAFFGLLYFRYLAPIEGVVVTAARLETGATPSTLLLPGLKVAILSAKPEGEVMSIATPDGAVGVVDVRHVRVI